MNSIFFSQKIKLENIKDFKKLLWIYYINNTKEAKEYLEIYDGYREEIIRIESEASEVNDQWNKAVELFNDRFIDMPFELSVSNNKEVALGIDNVAKINFIFKDAKDSNFQMRKNAIHQQVIRKNLLEMII